MKIEQLRVRNPIDIRELFFMRKKDGQTEISAAKDDKEIAALFEVGNALGWLWQHGYVKFLSS